MKNIRNWLGEDFFESLEKSYIYKPNTKTALDDQEIYISMQIVPKAVLSWLNLHLKPLENGGILDIDIPFGKGKLHINKIGPDVYSGEVTDSGRQITNFKFKSLPGVGLILTSTFELYENDKIVDIEKKPEYDDKISEIFRRIDDRIYLLELVNRIVDQKLSEREAINDMVVRKIAFFSHIKSDEKIEETSKEYQDGLGKLKMFLEKRQK